MPDDLSRVNLVSEDTPTERGIKQMLGELLREAPKAWKDYSKLWVYASDKTIEVARIVQKWRNPRNVIQKHSPKKIPDFDLAIVIPKPETSPIVAALTLKRNKPCAILLPSDLMQFIAIANDEQIKNERLENTIKECSKTVFASIGMMWLILKGKQTDKVYSIEKRALKTVPRVPGTHGLSSPPPAIFASRKSGGEEILIPNVHEWAEEQQSEREQFAKRYGKENIATRQDGLMVVVSASAPAKILVPSAQLQQPMKKST